MELSLDTPIRFVTHVGPARAAALERLGILTVQDLIYHIPFRYNDFSLVSPIARVQPGETVTVKGTVSKFNAFATKSGKRIQEAKVTDETGTLSVIWFNQPYLRSVVKPGMIIHLAGSINWFGEKIVMNAPEYELFDESPESSLHTGRLVPVYAATEGLSPKWLRGRIAQVLPVILPQIADTTPADIQKKYGLMELSQALSSVHFPQSKEDADDARRRLAFDEILSLQIQAHIQKFERESHETAFSLPLTKTGYTQFLGALPFELTADQNTAVEEILSDMKRKFPMNRLLVGDVGSGKTVVAAAALLACARNGKQSVVMAPTQILATQHFESLSTLLSKLSIRVGLVTGAHKEAHVQDCDVLVGTHALLSQTIALPRLGLIVIDEQHRFGVAQRTLLAQKSGTATQPHTLTMTATPIPRTVAKTLMGHMDLSTLTQMPSGRKPVKTWVVPKERRKRAYEWIAKQLSQTGGQAFIICPLIEESESLTTVRAVKKEYELLQDIFPQFSLGLLHGRMKPAEKTSMLDAFRRKEYTILVATPVVEVGIDIPNATLIVIEASERFGLSQMHQLRGRVGRGDKPSYCLLFTEEETPEIVSRLKILETETSGPSLAEADLTLRGAGDILGIRQHGIPNLKIASFRDTAIITQVQEAVSTLTKSDPTLREFPLLRERAKKSTITPSLD